jgi:hypothetical protein
MAAIDLKKNIAATPRGPAYSLSTTVATPDLPERAGVLPQALQDIARSYLGARRQSGVSLLDAARWLSEAKQAAKHGEWSIFLEAIGLDESRARAQIRIHEEAQRDPIFADRIVNGFLSETVARELLPLPAEKREELLARETPPTAQDVREAKRVLTPVLDPLPEELTARAKRVGLNVWVNALSGKGYTTAQDKGTANYTNHASLDDLTAFIASREGGPFWQSIDAHHPTAHLWTRERPDLLRSACGMTIQNRLPSGSTTGGHCGRCEVAAAGRPNSPAGWVWRDNNSLRHIMSGRIVKPQGTLAETVVEAERIARELFPPLSTASVPAETDDDRHRAKIAEIRNVADAIGMQVAWENDEVIVYWPEEDVDQLLGMDYETALGWLQTEGRSQAEHRQQLREIAQVNALPIEALPPPAPARLPAVPPRPRRPVSADVSATVGYISQLETYASALETYIMALQKQMAKNEGLTTKDADGRFKARRRRIADTALG